MIAIIIAPEKFRDEEFQIPYNLLKNIEEVEIYSTKKGIAKGMLGLEIEVKKTIEDIDLDKTKVLIFVGGAGVPIVRSNANVIELVKKAKLKNKIIAAICWAPTILAKAGVLNGKRATVWLGFDPEYNCRTDEVLKKYGAIFENKNVVVDGNIITANGPLAAKEFANKIRLSIEKEN